MKARLYIALGDAKNAEEIFRKYLNSGNTDAVLGLSQLYIQQHKYDAAEKLLISALSKSNDKYGETLLLVELYSTTNQKQKIFDLLNQAIKSTPKNHIYQILLAKVYYQYKMYQDAIKLCDKLIAYGISDGYKVKANSLIRLGKNADAKQVLNTLSVKEPNSAYAYIMLSYLAVKEKNHDAAMSYIDKALEVNPRNLNAVYTKLELLLNNKQNDEALKFAKSAATLFSDKQTNNLLLGFVYSRLGDTKNAYLNYLNAQDHGNLDVRLAVKTYKLSVEINGKEQASKEFDQWLEKNQNAENVFYAANYFLDQNEYKMAEKYYEVYLTKNQNNPTVYNNLAWLKLEQGKNTDALNYANKAFELAPSSPAVMDTLGLVLLKTGEYDKAGSYLLSAYQQLNDNPSVKYHLALFYYHKNNFDKSRSILQGIEHVKFAEQADAQKLLAEVNKHN